IADQLLREGPEGWSDASGRLDQAARMIQELRAPGSSAAGELSSGIRARLAELRECSAELERFEREGAEQTAALTTRECERARLEERIAALGSPEEAGPVPAELDPDALRRELEEVTRELACLGPVDETAEHREKDIVRELESLAPVL